MCLRLGNQWGLDFLRTYTDGDSELSAAKTAVEHIDTRKYRSHLGVGNIVGYLVGYAGGMVDRIGTALHVKGSLSYVKLGSVGDVRAPAFPPQNRTPQPREEKDFMRSWIVGIFGVVLWHGRLRQQVACRLAFSA